MRLAKPLFQAAGLTCHVLGAKDLAMPVTVHASRDERDGVDDSATLAHFHDGCLRDHEGERDGAPEGRVRKS